MTTRAGILFVSVFLSVCAAQAPVFDVVSIKPASSGDTERSLTQNPGARLTTSNATLKMLIMLAYKVMPDQISGGPPWLQSDGFDIEAKAANPHAGNAQFQQMVQNLMADRFQLKFHRETRELPVYLLTQAKNGVKLAEAKEPSADVGMRIEAPGRMIGVKATVTMLANALTKSLEAPGGRRNGPFGSVQLSLGIHAGPEAGHGARRRTVRLHGPGGTTRAAPESRQRTRGSSGNRQRTKARGELTPSWGRSTAPSRSRLRLARIRKSGAIALSNTPETEPRPSGSGA
jgi:uncharacterized protein (TIGR03435 family)